MKTEPKYLKLQSDLKRKIAGGVYRPGQKLPSVRQMAREHRLGLITVIRAYEDLKAEGWLESNERSGFFVRLQSSESPSSPLTRPRLGRYQGDVQTQVIEANRDPKLIPFGGASLHSSLLPTGDLRRCLARTSRRKGNAFFAYEPLGGTEELRREIVRRATNWGAEFSVDQCLVTSGATEALAVAIRAITKPGDSVAVESPTYFGLLTVLHLLGRKIVEVPTDPLTGMDVQHLEDLFRSKTVQACALIPNFQNPTGALMPDAAKQSVAELARRYQIPVVECDTSGDLYLDGARPRPIQCFEAEWVLSVQSFSKLVAPGLRVGYLAPGRFLKEAREIKRGLSLATSSGPQLALAEFIREGSYDKHLRRLRSHFRRTLPQWHSLVAESFPAETRVSRPAGGYLLWVQLPGKASGKALWEKAIQAGISISPGELFSLTGKYGDYIRLNCAVPLEGKSRLAMEKVGHWAARPSLG